MKLLIQTLFLGLIVSSCSSSKNVASSTTDNVTTDNVTTGPVGEVVINQYCSEDEFPTIPDAFRACETGESNDQSVAKKKAMNNCRTLLAASINSTVKTVSENYIKSTEVNNQEQILEKLEESSVSIVNETLSGAQPICTKLTKTTDGKFHYYVTLEIQAEEVLENLSQGLTEIDILKVEKNYQNFKNVYESEMAKMK